MTSIHAIERADLDAAAEYLLGYRNKRLPASYWRQRFSYWWDDNPAFDESCIRGWIMRDAGRIVGFLGQIPRCYTYAGADILAVASSTWAVDEAYRGDALALYLTFIRENRQRPLWATTLSERTEAIVDGLGFTVAPGCSDGYRLLLSGPRLPGACGASLQGIVNRHWPISGTGNSPMVVERLDRAGPEFDELWSATRGQADATRCRSASDVNWSCFSWPDGNKLLLAARLAGRLTGFAILQPLSVNGLRLLDGLDLWWDWSVPGTVESLLGAAMNYAKRRGLDGLSVLSSDRYSATLNGWARNLPLSGLRPNRIRPPQDFSPAVNAWFCRGEGDVGC
jgi:hypothetical protein